MENAQIADIFDEIADLIELQDGNPFRVRSYRNAARTVRNLGERLEDGVDDDKALSDLPNIGDRTADKIREILRTGTCKRLENLREQVPGSLVELMKVPRLGPRTAMQLYKQLDITSLDELVRACRDHKVRELEGMGAKTERKLLDNVQAVRKESGRMLLHDAMGFVESLGRFLDRIDTIQQWSVVGSFRRGRETVGDLDILVRARDREEVNKAIRDYADIEEVISEGQERTSVRLHKGPRVDIRYFEEAAFGAAQLYFTGSKEHNVRLRRIARQKDWKLNEYGLFSGDRRLAGKTEETVYSRLNMPWVPPELREDRGEIEAAKNDALPDLVQLKHIRGDLHTHTNSTDGNNSLDEMVEAARRKGYDYLAITDHSKAVRVADGLDDRAAREQAKTIHRMNGQRDDIWILAGIEVDILKSGALDLARETLQNLDWVVASIHYNREMSQKQMTDRIVRAIQSGMVHCIGHLTGRIIGKREPIPIDAEHVFQACLDNKVCLEINAQPDRLDLPDTYCKQAADMGVRFVIDTDAHSRADFNFINLGVTMARRGWVPRKQVINTWTAKQLKKWLER